MKTNMEIGLEKISARLLKDSVAVDVITPSGFNKFTDKYC